MEFANLTAIAVAVGSIGAVIATNLLLRKQIKQNSKIASADLSLRMLEVIRREEYRKILKSIKNGHELEEDDIHRILNHYEYLADFSNGKLIDFDHLLHHHGANIKMLYNNKMIKRVFEESRKYDKSDYIFVNLNKLFEKLGNDFLSQDRQS